MIEFKNVSLSIGSKQLLDHADLTIDYGDKVGLIGRNGSGKSSILNLILGELKEESGTFFLQKDLKISYVSQDIEDKNIKITDHVLNGDLELQHCYKDLEIAQLKNDGFAIASAHDRLSRIDGYSAYARACTLLKGLGFTDRDFERSLHEFSGGWQMRANLAQALFCPGDLLLLDEPTNHLDIETIIWLESWLAQFKGSLIVIAHDIEFLDHTVNKIVEIHQKKLNLYRGDYSSYLKQSAEKKLLQVKMLEKQMKKKAHLENFVNRFRAKASKAKQAQSRLKMLEKLPQIELLQEDSAYSFTIDAPLQCPNPLISLNNATIGYAVDQPPLLKEINLQMGPGDRIGLLGKNGQGKSTLIKTLTAELPLLGGQLITNSQVKIGYFAQHQLDVLDHQESVLWHLERLNDAKIPTQQLRDYLAKFGFKGDEINEPIVAFSGGEKARLALSLIAWKKPHILLLDEPTNHLDLEMRQSLILALSAYQGAVVLVSHDRALMNAVVDRFVLLHDKKLIDYDGDLQSYSQMMLVSPVKPQSKEIEKKNSSNNNFIQIQKLERKMADLADKIKKIEQMMNELFAQNSFDQERSIELSKQKASLENQLHEVEESWLNLNHD